MKKPAVTFLIAVLMLLTARSTTASSLNCGPADQLLCETMLGKPCWKLKGANHEQCQKKVKQDCAPSLLCPPLPAPASSPDASSWREGSGSHCTWEDPMVLTPDGRRPRKLICSDW